MAGPDQARNLVTDLALAYVSCARDEPAGLIAVTGNFRLTESAARSIVTEVLDASPTGLTSPPPTGSAPASANSSGRCSTIGSQRSPAPPTCPDRGQLVLPRRHSGEFRRAPPPQASSPRRRPEPHRLNFGSAVAGCVDHVQLCGGTPVPDESPVELGLDWVDEPAVEQV